MDRFRDIDIERHCHLVSAISLGLLQILTANRHYRLVLLMVGAAAIILVISPSVATQIAQWLTVGRGADLVIYISIVLLGVLWVRLFLRGRAEKRQITILTRTIAISGARFPDVAAVNVESTLVAHRDSIALSHPVLEAEDRSNNSG